MHFSKRDPEISLSFRGAIERSSRKHIDCARDRDKLVSRAYRGRQWRSAENYSAAAAISRGPTHRLRFVARL